MYKSVTFKNTWYKYDSTMNVLANILNSYLWDKVRVNGGAYGASVSIGQTGIMFSSWDPQTRGIIEDGLLMTDRQKKI